MHEDTGIHVIHEREYDRRPHLDDGGAHVGINERIPEEWVQVGRAAHAV